MIFINSQDVCSRRNYTSEGSLSPKNRSDIKSHPGFSQFGTVGRRSVVRSGGVRDARNADNAAERQWL
jgi:hypothetical protein